MGMLCYVPLSVTGSNNAVSLPSERMEKEAEEERVRKQKAAAERAFQDGIAKAKLVLRRIPLGTDRNHNRSARTLQWCTTGSGVSFTVYS